ncbi:hypothetical protein ABOM_007451 [Aspergillus bombycis]|uniref:Uncharacterized protein n=1 Tax=Aspergillus bombycis TaxID=109264 RepID=A0A1F7ZYZ1_9EURO|nr:hypothetical protein ABOM_007451 [Aspergillus bombycis]OGM44676.1 hypothetical protein ABOM_007451 [Aspergillus bombycis]
MAIATTELKQSINFFRQASRASVHGRSSLAAISHGKLQKESFSPTPDLRRCLGHHGVFRKCVQAAQEAASQPAHASCGVNSSKAIAIPGNATKHRPAPPPIRSQITQAIKAMTQRRHVSAFIKPENDLIRIPDSPRKRNMVDSLQCRVKLLLNRRSSPKERYMWRNAAG